MFSPMLSFSIQKLVLRASPMAFPPFSVMLQLKTSNSTMDWFARISEATANAPSSPILEFLKYSFLIDSFEVSRILHSSTAQEASSLQSAMLSTSILVF